MSFRVGGDIRVDMDEGYIITLLVLRVRGKEERLCGGVVKGDLHDLSGSSYRPNSSGSQ